MRVKDYRLVAVAIGVTILGAWRLVETREAWQWVFAAILFSWVIAYRDLS